MHSLGLKEKEYFTILDILCSLFTFDKCRRMGNWSCISIEPPDKGPVLFRLGSFCHWLFVESSSYFVLSLAICLTSSRCQHFLPSRFQDSLIFSSLLYEKSLANMLASALELEIDASSHIYIPSEVSCWSNFILLWFSHLGDIMKLFDHQELFSIEFQYYILYFCK